MFIDQKQRNAYFRRAIRADSLEFLMVILARMNMPEKDRRDWVDQLPRILEGMKQHGILQQAIDVCGGEGFLDDFDKLFTDEQEYWRNRLTENIYEEPPPKLTLLRPAEGSDDED